MRKTIVVFVYFILMIVLLVGCMPPTFMPPAKVYVDPGDNITDVSIAVDQNGTKHIVGIKDNQVVYFKGNIGEPTYQFTIGWGELPSGTDTSTWEQHQSEIAVLDNGTAHIVWWEHRDNPDEKTACHYEVPQIYDPPEEIGCVALDPLELYTSGLVRVIAKGNTAYAVYDQISSSSIVKRVWYKKLDDETPGLVVSYADTIEAFITSMDLAIDNNGKLHLAYIDETTSSPPRLIYRSNATTTTGTYEYMSQIWEIEEPGLQDDIQPSIEFFDDGTDTFVMIASVYGGTNQSIWLDSCTVEDCSGKVSWSPTKLHTDWDDYSSILEVKGLGTTEDYMIYTLSFIADNDLTSNNQVWYWQYPFSDNPVQVTDTTYAKSQLNMVAGSNYAPVVGFVEHYTRTSPFLSFIEKVSVYDVIKELREIKTNSCLVLPDDTSSDMASYIESGADFLPVAGVWNYCGTTWFTTNAHLISLPIILK